MCFLDRPALPRESPHVNKKKKKLPNITQMDPAVEVNPEPVTPMQTEEPVVEEPDDIPQIFPPAKDSEETNVSLTEEIVTFVNRIDSPTLLDLLVQLGCDPLTEDAASQEERIQKFEALVVYKFGVESFYNMLLSFPDLLARYETKKKKREKVQTKKRRKRSVEE